MILGIDYASVDENARPDVDRLVKAGVRFAAIRGTYETWTDPTWKRDHAALRAGGLVAMPYLFPLLGPKHPAPEEQVAAFVTSVEVDRGRDTMVALDVEFPGGLTKTGLSRAEAFAWLDRAARALIKAYGAPPVLYSSKRVLDGDDDDSLSLPRLTLLADSPLFRSPLWLARYPYKTGQPAVSDPAVIDVLPWPPVPVEWGDRTNVWIHQYQGDARNFAGMRQVDLNRFFPMALGATGDRVRWVQRRIAMAEGTLGVFDVVTDHALRAFQVQRGLVDDGIIGPRTFAALTWTAPAKSG